MLSDAVAAAGKAGVAAVAWPVGQVASLAGVWTPATDRETGKTSFRGPPRLSVIGSVVNVRPSDPGGRWP